MSAIYVIGKTGQLARSLQKIAPQWTYLSRQDLDLQNLDGVRGFFKNRQPRWIVNASAYTQVDKAEDERETAFIVNCEASGVLSGLCENYIYVSTDYVFSGQSDIPWNEDSPTDPVNTYGLSKLEGENASRLANSHTYVLRTSWLYSEYGVNFVRRMLELAQTRKTLTVVTDQLGTPTYAHDLAQVIVKLVEKDGTVAPGVYHYSNLGSCSWNEFAKEIFHLKNLNIQVDDILTSAYPTRARRPYYSVLSKNKITAALGLEIPHWKDSLKKCLQNIS